MAQSTATVQITNSTGCDGYIILQHYNSSGVQNGVWYAASGDTVGSITVPYDTDYIEYDYWWVYFGQIGGNIYTSSPQSNSSSPLVPGWTELLLHADDANTTLTFSVTLDTFTMNTSDNPPANNNHIATAAMNNTNIPFYIPVTNVFVLMLENHSFDCMLGNSGISGITPSSSYSNTYNGTQYDVYTPAPVTMPTDPGHEFPDVLQQLTNIPPANIKIPVSPYPPVVTNPNDTGFATNYATTTDEGDPVPTASEIGEIMAGFLPDQIPNLYNTAVLNAPCSNWFSSMPGATWPNRFFAHCASAGTFDASPSTLQMAAWYQWGEGFSPPNGTIYDNLSAANLPYRFYNDNYPLGNPLFGFSAYSDDPLSSLGPLGGGYVPQVAALLDVHLAQINSVQTQFASDLNSPYPYVYTFIEPHYGNIVGGTYEGGSSQHPLDDVAGGENLLGFIYNTIHDSPIWNSSILIVTYDEHGGFYDSTTPPAAVPPGDGDNGATYGFSWDNYGVRVPAIVAGHYITEGVVDDTVYDHTSILSFIEQLFGMPALTNRDGSANNMIPFIQSCYPGLNPAASVKDKPRIDTSKKPSTAGKIRPRKVYTAEEMAAKDLELLPERGNEIGTLGILLKTEIELSGGTEAERIAIVEHFNTIKTRGEAKDYAASVMKKMADVTANKNKKK